MSKINLKERVERSKKYLEYLDYSLRHSWLKQFEEYQTGKLSYEQSMALIHPLHYKETARKGKIRGARSFQSEPSLGTFSCESELLWGYKCPVSLREYENIQADHIFPYSLGGPTRGENKIHLCNIHNLSKSSDFHVFPWEKDDVVWLDDILDRIRREVA